MLADARRLDPESRLEADICIVGAGAAGITLANELLGTGFKVILLEAGGRRYHRQSQAFYAGESAAPEVHAPPSMYRQRRFGGSTAIWGGRCVALDEIDFEPRDWVPHSGWPFRRKHLLPYYEKAMRYCEAGAFDFSETCLANPTPLIQGFVSGAIDSSTIERFSPPTNFAEVHGRRLLQSSSVTVMLNAACLQLVSPAASRSIVTSLRCSTAAGNLFEVRARFVVLAAGGLETTRLLLASSCATNHGLGNSSGRLGHFYMCHIEGTLGTLALEPADRPVAWRFERTNDGIYVKRRFVVTAEHQRRRKTLNMILRLHHAQPADHRHGNPVLSAMYLVKRFIVPEYRRKIAMVDYSLEAARRATAAHLLAHCGNVVRHIPELARFGADWIRRRHLQRRRIPYVALRARNGRYPLDFNAEQTPNPDSRVTLSDERDAFGVPRLRVDWQLSAQDVDSIVENYAAFGRDVTASGIGRLDLDGRDLRGWAQQSAPVGGHHIGTTRMCDDPRHGVVDSNCCLHDVANVYVAGSSVFPTSGNANPTLTIVALAIRIADRLKLAHGLR